MSHEHSANSPKANCAGAAGTSNAPHPRTFATAADDLHTALQALGIQRPVVAGHSLGGALAQVYAARYGAAGVVLVDGLTSGVVDPVVNRMGSYRSLGPLAQAGLLRPLAGALMAVPAYPPSLRDQMIALRARASALVRRSSRCLCSSSPPNRPTFPACPPAPSPKPPRSCRSACSAPRSSILRI